jgi:hypothetical protein
MRRRNTFGPGGAALTDLPSLIDTAGQPGCTIDANDR